MTVLRILFWVIFQALIFSGINMFGCEITPQLHLFALLLIPIQVDRFVWLFGCAAAGLALDFCTGTYGLHLLAGVLLGAAIPTIHRAFAPRDGYEVSDRPTVHGLGFRWVLLHTFACSAVYCIAIESIASFQFHLLSASVWRGLLCAVLTTVLVLLLQYLVLRSPKRSRN
jgi:cell shape-determining protein MreD